MAVGLKIALDLSESIHHKIHGLNLSADATREIGSIAEKGIETILRASYVIHYPYTEAQARKLSPATQLETSNIGFYRSDAKDLDELPEVILKTITP